VTYTQLGVLAMVLALLADLVLLRTRLLARKVFWVSYAIILVFQLLSNGALTGLGIVRYSGEAIIGSGSPVDSAPPFIGDGRLAFAPVEDLMFGFALVLLTLAMWIWLGRRGVQREPAAGPPVWRRGGQKEPEPTDRPG